MPIDSVTPVLDTSLFLIDLRHRRLDGVLEELASFAVGCGAAMSDRRLYDVLLRRERLGGSALGKGVAAPHARTFAMTESLTLVARSARGIEWRARDGQAVHLVLATFASGDTSLEVFHDRLARAVGFARLQRQRQRLLAARSTDECRALFAAADA